MDIDTTKTEKEILEDIYRHTINNLNISFQFKPDTEFEKWYNPVEKSVIFPYPGIDDPELALHNSRYPVIHMDYSEGKIGLGLAFWTGASVNENLIGVLNSKSKKNRNWMLESFQNLSPRWEWQFKINEKVGENTTEAVFVKPCAEIDDGTLNIITRRLAGWLQDRKDEDEEFGTVSHGPAVNYIYARVAPEDYAEPAAKLFELFNNLNTSVSVLVLKKAWAVRRKKSLAFIESMEQRRKSSQFGQAIEARIEETRKKVSGIDAAFCMV